MKWENESFLIYYNEEDKNVVYLIDSLNEGSKQIMNFFNLKSFSNKIVIKIYYLLDDYITHVNLYLSGDNRIYQDWMKADTFDGNINMLSLDLCQKSQVHKNFTLEDFKKSILHELTHICHHKLTDGNNQPCYTWLAEGLATNLSGQKYNSKINCTYEELITNFYNAKNSYGVAYQIVKYGLENYGKDFILKLINNYNELNIIAPLLFEEAKSKMGSNVNSI